MSKPSSRSSRSSISRSPIARAGLAARAARGELRHRARRGLRPGRRIGLRQVDGGLSAAGLSPSQQPHRGRPRRCSRASDLLELDRPALDRLRGDRISFVPQNPTTALNPGMRVGSQIGEMLRAPWPCARSGQATARARRAVPPGRAAEVRRRSAAALSPPAFGRPAAARLHRHGAGLRAGSRGARRADHRPRRHDAGADRRAADRSRASASSMSMLYVTHDLGVLAQIADRVGVMYAGRYGRDRADRRSFRASRAIPIPAA